MSRNKKNWDYLVDYAGQYQNVLGSGQKGGTGTQGAKGQKGETGSQGLQGLQGVGQKGDKGSIGEKGVPSTDTFKFSGTVSDQGSLPTTGNSQGDVYQTLDTNDLYVYDGNGFVLLSGGGSPTVVKGDKGDKGDDGDKGDKGDFEKGDKGDAGVDGTKGDEGDKGDKGELPLISSLPVLP